MRSEKKPVSAVAKPESEWRKILEPARFGVLFHEDTERPWTSPLNDIKQDGTFICAACHQPLFEIHWAEAERLQGPWRDRGVLLRPTPDPEFRDVWLGGGAPPLLLQDGRYLMLYHIGKRRVDGTREYDLGLALLDPRAHEPILRRVEPLLRPETAFETIGDPNLGVNNVVFVCGAYFWRGNVYFPYAGADTCVLAARIPRAALDFPVTHRGVLPSL